MTITKEHLAGMIRPVKGFEGLYEVSALGDVYSLRHRTRYYDKPHKKPVKLTHVLDKGYPRVDLQKDKKRTFPTVHKLVLEAFYGPAPSNLEGAHLDGDRANCSVLNLAWMTRKSNAGHASVHGTRPRGSNNHRAVLTEADIPKIRADPRSDVKIAKDYEIAPSAIYSVKVRRTWRHV